MKYIILFPLIILSTLKGSLKGQVSDYGHIKEGLIEIMVKDSTTDNLEVKKIIEKRMQSQFEKSVYYSPKGQVEIRERPNSELRTYYTNKTGVFYTVLRIENETYYSIDSSQIWFYENAGIKKSMDSLKTVFNEKEKIAPKEKYLNIDCSVVDFKSETEEGSVVFYLTKKLNAKTYGDKTTSALAGYPLKTKMEITPGLFVIFGATEINPLEPNNPIFKLNLSNYIKISNIEMSRKLGPSF